MYLHKNKKKDYNRNDNYFMWKEFKANAGQYVITPILVVAIALGLLHLANLRDHDIEAKYDAIYATIEANKPGRSTPTAP